MMKFQQIPFFSFFFCLGSLSAQDADRVAFGASKPAANRIILDAPKNITASDGLYDRYVLIRWESSEDATRYKVYRTDKPKGGSLMEISSNWQQSTWLCDYNALPGVEYYYAVVASNGSQNTKMSAYDKGFVRKKDIAEDSKNSLSSSDKNEKFAHEKQVLLMINTAMADKTTYSRGESVNVSVQMSNIADESSRPTEIRFFLSKNAILDWNDKNLSLKTLAAIPAGANLTVTESVVIPKNEPSGDVFLIIVSSSEGHILNSRTHVVKIKIKD